MSNKWLMGIAVFTLLALVGAVTWESGKYGSLGSKNMYVQKVFDSTTISANTTTSSDWLPLGRYSYIGVYSYVEDDAGTSTEAVTLTYNLSTEPEVTQSGTTTIYSSVGTDTNGNWRADPLTLSTMPFIRFHAASGVSDVDYNLHLIRAD